MSALRRARAQLRVRLDSLQRELEDMSVESPDRVPRFREITALLSSLANLSDLEDAARPNAASMRTLRSRGEAPMPRSMTFARPFVSDAMLLPGWIGINIEAPHQQMVRGDTAYFRYFSYPEIVSVEPDSPAERAGISRGDRLVAYDGDDVRDREINMTRLLQPSRRITVTVRRDGEEREFPLTVVRPPPRLMTRRLLTMPDEPGRAPAAPMILMPPNGARRMRAPIAVKVVTGDGSTPIAGASLSEIRDEELGRIFGVNSGLLVTEVFSDPAQASGLRGGDVIVGADGRDITRLAQLRAIIVSHNDDRAVDLEVVRQKRTRTITLRW
jgi:voltage-gated potassium channel Kch